MRFVGWGTRLSAIVVLSVGSAACASSGSDTASETGDPAPTTVTTESLGSIVEPELVGAPLRNELLTVGDLPAAGSWRVDELRADFWGGDKFSVHICDPIGSSVWAFIPPTDEERRVGRVLTGQGQVNEAVVSGDSSELKEVFQAITQQLTECLEGPADPNLALTNWEVVAARMPALGVGDAEFLIDQRLYDQQYDPPNVFCHHRLAVVLDDTRLILVEHSTVGGAETVSDGAFALMVERAAERITP